MRPFETAPSRQMAVDDLIAALKGAGEPTRLRLLLLLTLSELSVTEITGILRQSQPRVSRHLKLLTEAGLVERHREGSFALYRAASSGPAAVLVEALVALVPAKDPVVERDRQRLDQVRLERVEQAAAYFKANADQWDSVRALYLPEAEVEAAMRTAAGERPISILLDVGTGTGRMLEVFSDRIGEGIGIDNSPEMLRFARANLERNGAANCQVRQADLFSLPFGDGDVDCVTVHQVLHYLDDPKAAIAEAGRVMSPGGLLLIADFAPHEIAELRDAHAHRRLGFAHHEIAGWCDAAGLSMRQIVDLPPGKGAGGEALTVTIWCAERVPGQRRPETVRPEREEARP